MFVGSLQPTDAQDDAIRRPSATLQSCAVCRFSSVFAGICKQKHSTEKLSITFQHHACVLKFLF